MADKVIRYRGEFDASDILASLKKIRSEMSAGGVKDSMFANVDKDIAKAESLVTSLTAQLQKGFRNTSEIKKFSKDLNGLETIYSRIGVGLEKIADPKNFSTSSSALKKYQAELSKLRENYDEVYQKAQDFMKNNFTESQYKQLNKAVEAGEDLEEVYKRLAAVRFQEKINSVNKAFIRSDYEYSDYRKNTSDAPLVDKADLNNHFTTENMGDYQDTLAAIATGALTASQGLKYLEDQLDETNKEVLESDNFSENFVEDLRTMTQALVRDSGMSSSGKGQVTKALNSISNLGGAVNAQGGFTLTSGSADLTDYINNSQRLHTLLSSIEEEERRIGQAAQDGANNARAGLSEVTTSQEEVLNGARASTEAMMEEAQSSEQLNNTFARMKGAIQQFLSIGSAIQGVRRIIRQTFTDVQNIDKAFTEIAMVTSYSVQEMWGTYDQYAEIANELGQTTESVIRASGLYYQQGLDTNEAISLATDTMKLATLAGLDFEQATSLMTAAIRGFHMEMDQGTHVTDVYSELAAKAAASVNDIAQAMSRTSSIANSAGMSFENTSAMLTTMIEATQESPENLGTAMKTIIARFTELKDNVSAADSEFDDLDLNKVDKALKSIGVSLKDTNGQFRNIDDVLLETSEKWDGLDRNTQRYIATIAAGSRQQSRFIALMENYDRTMELIETAQDSTGKSAEQFAKYQDSVENKVNRLKNSWEQLRLSFLQSDTYKTVIDGLNKIVSVLGKIDRKRLAAIAIVGATIGKALVTNLIDNMRTNAQDTKKASHKIKQQIIDGFRQEKINKINLELEVNEQSLQLAKEKLETTNQSYNKHRAELDLLKERLPYEELSLQQAILENGEGSEEVNNARNIVEELKQKINYESSTLEARKKNVESAKEELRVLQEQNKELNNKKKGVPTTGSKSAVFSGLSTGIASAITAGITTALAGGDLNQVIKAFGSTFAITFVGSFVNTVVPMLLEKLAKTGIATSLASTLTAALPVLLPALIVAAVIAGVAAYADHMSDDKVLQRKIKAAKESLEESSTNLSNQSSAAQESKEEYDNLAQIQKKYTELSEIKNKTTEQQQEYNELLETVKEDYPELVSIVNEETGEYKIQNELLDEKIKKLEKIEKEDQQALLGATRDTAREELELTELEARQTISNAKKEQKELQHKYWGEYAEGYQIFTKKGEQGLREDLKSKDLEYNIDDLIKTYEKYGEEFEEENEKLKETIGKAKDDLTTAQDTYNNTLNEANETYLKNMYGISDNLATLLSSDKYKKADATVLAKSNTYTDIESFVEALGGGLTTTGDFFLPSNNIKKWDKVDSQTQEAFKAGFDESQGDIATFWNKRLDDEGVKELYKIYQRGAEAKVLGDNLSSIIDEIGTQEISLIDKAFSEMSLKTYSQLSNLKVAGVNSDLGNQILSDQAKIIKDNIESILSNNDEYSINVTDLLGINKDNKDDFFNNFTEESAQSFYNSIQGVIDKYGTDTAEGYLKSVSTSLRENSIPEEDFAKIFSILDFSEAPLKGFDEWKENKIEELKAAGVEMNTALMDSLEDAAKSGGILKNYFSSGADVQSYAETVKGQIDFINSNWSAFEQAFSTSEETFSGTVDNIDEIKNFLDSAAEAGLTGLGNPEDYYAIDEVTGEVVVNAEKLRKLYDEQTDSLKEQFRILKENTQDELKNKQEQRLKLQEKLNKGYKAGIATESNGYSYQEYVALTESEKKEIENQISELDESIELSQKAAEAYGEVESVLKQGLAITNANKNALTNTDVQVEKLTDSLKTMADTYNTAFTEMQDKGHLSASTITSFADAVKILNSNLTSAGVNLPQLDASKFLSKTNTGIQLNIQSFEDYIDEIFLAMESTKGLADSNWQLYYALLAQKQAFQENREELYKTKQEEIDTAWDTYQDKLEAEAKARETLTEKIEAQAEAERKLQEAYYGTENHKNQTDPLYNYQTQRTQPQDRQTRAKDNLENATSRDDIRNYVNDYFQSTHDEIVNLQAQNELINQHINNQKEILDSKLSNELARLKAEGAVDMSLNVADFYEEIDGRWYIDYDRLNAANIPDDISNYIESVVEDMNKYAKSIEDNLDAIKAKEKELKDFQEKARDDYLNVVNKVADVLKEKYQQEINDVQDKYTAIKEADDDYLNALEEAINKQRELRNKASQWDDLAKQEKKLSLKMRDTSGANAKEVQKLQEDTQKKREELLDNTVDDIVKGLKEVYEEQQETRDAEIEYRQAVLDNKNLIEEATAIVNNWDSVEDAKAFFLSMDEEYIKASGETLEKLLEDVESYYADVQTYQEARLMDIEAFTQTSADEVQHLTQTMSETMTTEADRAMNEVTAKVDETINSAKDAVTSAIEAVTQAQQDLTKAIQESADAWNAYAEAAAAGKAAGGTDTSGGGGGNNGNDTTPEKHFTNGQIISFDYNTTSGYEKFKGTMQALQDEGWHGAYHLKNGEIIVSDSKDEASRQAALRWGYGYSVFKTGGLVDYTGPAWVDGTPTQPEAFLNYEDTRNIGQLTDVLRELRIKEALQVVNDWQPNKDIGDTHIEININIENVSSDYDVDQAVERVRQDIVDIATQAGSTVILHK